MKQRLETWVDSVSNRLPDLRGVPRQKQAAIGLGVSVLIHVAILLVAALVAWVVPDRVLAPAAKPEEAQEVEEKTVEIELVADPELLLPPVKPEWKAPKLVPLQADGLAPSERAPEKPVFESSQNMVAASERAGQGVDPVPSQDGRVLPFRQFKNQRASLGVRDIPMTGVEQSVEAGSGQAGSEPGKVEPGKAGAVAGGQEEKRSVSEDRDALLLPGAGKGPVQKEPAEAVGGESGGGGAPGQRGGGYAPELTQTRVEASISNRGLAAMDAVKTPMGVYRQQICMQIGSRWEYHRRKRMDVIALGTVRVRFYVTREGRVQDLKILECSSNRTFEEVCERSVREAEIAPPPPEVELMNDGRMEMVFTFTIF